MLQVLGIGSEPRILYIGEANLALPPISIQSFSPDIHPLIHLATSQLLRDSLHSLARNSTWASVEIYSQLLRVVDCR